MVALRPSTTHRASVGSVRGGKLEAGTVLRRNVVDGAVVAGEPRCETGSDGMWESGHSERRDSHQHQRATASHTSDPVRAVLRVGRSGIRVGFSVDRVGDIGGESLLGGLQVGTIQAAALFEALEGTAGADALGQASAPTGASVVGFDAFQQTVRASERGSRRRVSTPRAPSYQAALPATTPAPGSSPRRTASASGLGVVSDEQYAATVPLGILVGGSLGGQSTEEGANGAGLGRADVGQGGADRVDDNQASTGSADLTPESIPLGSVPRRAAGVKIGGPKRFRVGP